MTQPTMHFGSRQARCPWAWLMAVACLGCSDPEARPQWVIEIDTDAPLTTQVLSRPDLPSVVAIDSLRIDVLGPDGSVADHRDVVAPDVRDWPLSFGLVAEEDVTRVRIRAFRGQDAVPEEDGALLPPPRRAIDRLVVLGPASEKRRVRVDLALACLGRQPSFIAPERSCIDEARPEAPATEGLVAPGAATAAGTAPWLEVEPCSGSAPEGTVCIPGGIDVLGDARLQGLEDSFALGAAPPLPVRISPLFMDRFEVTVGEARALFAAGVMKTSPPLTYDFDDPDRLYCNWVGVADPSRDDHPVNCVGVDTAEEICAARGARLPTEAEWEHAARGRGRGEARPWGDEDPICCATQAGVNECSRPPGTAPVDAHATPPDCALADVSRDGVVGLAGNVNELTADAADDYDGPCWQYAGVPRDPRCDLSDPIRVARGGSWNNSLTLTHAAFRIRYVPSGNGGLRCVYDDVPEDAR